ncbi:MAG TPA: heavy metal-associated domain-containing protein [Pseudonocardiaceae bacterium]|nr:heavy metal-associated domain-containing protein [Pseudonocardiaceae bacterium]
MSISTHAFRVEGMHCASCALLIDDALADLPGVRGTQTKVKAGLSTVELDRTHTRPEDVITAIEQLGYRASPLP